MSLTDRGQPNMTEARSSNLREVVRFLAANHIDHDWTTTGTNVPVVVIPVPTRRKSVEASRWSGPTKGTFVVTDNDDLELLFYPDATWTDGDYDDEAMASAAKIDVRRLISAIYDFGQPLNEIMEFDHVIEVKANGLIVEVDGVYAPTLRNGELETGADDWDLMDGYSGQDRYSGPIMNNAEFIGGGMERDIRETPGIYVALVCDWDPDEDEDPDEDDTAEGWAVARMEVPE